MRRHVSIGGSACLEKSKCFWIWEGVSVWRKSMHVSFQGDMSLRMRKNVPVWESLPLEDPTHCCTWRHVCKPIISHRSLIICFWAPRPGTCQAENCACQFSYTNNAIGAICKRFNWISSASLHPVDWRGSVSSAASRGIPWELASEVICTGSQGTVCCKTQMVEQVLKLDTQVSEEMDRRN